MKKLLFVITLFTYLNGYSQLFVLIGILSPEPKKVDTTKILHNQFQDYVLFLKEEEKRKKLIIRKTTSK